MSKCMHSCFVITDTDLLKKVWKSWFFNKTKRSLASVEARRFAFMQRVSGGHARYSYTVGDFHLNALL